MNISVFNLDR